MSALMEELPLLVNETDQRRIPTMEELPLLVTEADERRIPAGSKLHVLLISLLTGWSWEKAAFLSGNENVAKLKSLTSCLQLLYIILIALMVIIAMVMQGIISFRRDRLDESSVTESMHVPAIQVQVDLSMDNHGDRETESISTLYNASNYKPDLQLFADDIILNITTGALLIWVVCNKLSSLCKSTETENLHEEDKHRPKDTLTHLVDAVRYTHPNKVASKLFVIIPFLYIIFSILVSFMYLHVYFNHKTRVMWPKDWNITGSHFKLAVFAVILLGTTAIDLLYIQILLKYVFQCQLNIYFLQLIINKVENKTYRDQDEAIQDVVRAQKFLKQLNRSSRITGFAIITALIQAIYCATNLLNDMDDSKEKSKMQFEEIALIFRLFLWICLAMVPFYQAARTNEASEALSDTDLDMTKSPVLFDKNTRSQNQLIKMNARLITLRARIFHLPIKPGFIYLAVIVMLLSFALKPVFKLYEQLL